MIRSFPPSAALIVIASICAALLYLPGQTITAAFINDVLIFLDGAHRIAFGQVPNRDFHSALGPVSFYVPAIGYQLTGSLGAAMPTGMALLLLGFIPPMIRILSSRLHAVLAIGLGSFLILVLAAPINLGSPATMLSFAMFYNRIGWVALGVLVVAYLRPYSRTRRSDCLDAFAAAFLVLIQLYTKLTYGLVSVAFVVFLLHDRQQRFWAALSLALVVVALVFIELAWHGSRQYLADLAAVAQVSGHRHFAEIIKGIFHNLADVAVFLVFAGFCLSRSRSIADLFFLAFCFGSGVMILAQNAHAWGIITIYSAAVVACERVLRCAAKLTGHAATTGLPLLLIFFFLPPIAHHGFSLAYHSALARMNAGVSIGLPRFTDLRFLAPADGRDFMADYVTDIEGGGKLLQGLESAPERVMVLDFANPFSAGLNLRPPKGDFAWLHWGRNISNRSHPPGGSLFADVKILMVPRYGINSAPLQDLYGDFIAEHFEPMRASSRWLIYGRRQDGETAR